MPTVDFFFSAGSSRDRNLKLSHGPCNKQPIVPVTHHPLKGWHTGPAAGQPSAHCCTPRPVLIALPQTLTSMLACYYLQEQFYDFLSFQLLDQG